MNINAPAPRVLLVDDDRMDNPDTGFPLCYFEQLRRRSPPLLLFLDHKMPGMSGLEVLKATQDLQSEMLTIMITAYASIETAVQATKRGAYDFLAKPFTPDERERIG